MTFLRCAATTWIVAGALFAASPECAANQESARAVFRPEKLAEMDAAISKAIEEGRCPGGVLWVEHKDAAYHKAYGHRALIPAQESMTEDTIFDAASLTKVIACTPALMLLIERDQIALEDPVRKHIPEFTGGRKQQVTIRELLIHTSGLPGDIETSSDWTGQKAAVAKACEEKLLNEPGTHFLYSDINFFLLGEIVQRVAGMPLEEFTAKEIYGPLKMVDTGFLPPGSKLDRIAPTEVRDGKPLRGIVHDPTARKMGGVAGHAGLFTTAADLARFCRMMLNEGELEGVRVFRNETVRLMTSVQSPPELPVRRGLGWDIDSPYAGPRGHLFPLGSYGHSGWTGTSVWIDPFSQSFVIFLSNRNHPTEQGNVITLRSRLATLAAEAIPDFNFAYVPGALAPLPQPINKVDSAAGVQAVPRAQLETLNGIDVLVSSNFSQLRGLRVALITNHTGQDRRRNRTIDLLFHAPDVQLKALFSPEHGIAGTKDEKVTDSVDEKTGLRVYSLYGDHTKPTPEQLKDIDALVFDIQDVGCRFYTYSSTLALTLEAAAENHKKFVVLDRVNPIGGTMIDGPMLSGEPSFVAYHRVPIRHGMTLGELARMFNSERKCNADLAVIALQNWRREAWFDETGLPWTNPSPNMRNLAEAILYPGIGLLESAVSVGRGTDTPFEVIGAPYIDDIELARVLTRSGLPGVSFIPVQFTPSASVHKGEVCKGVHIILTDRERCNVVEVGIEIAKSLFRLYPHQFRPEKMDYLLRDPFTFEAIKSDRPLSEIRAAWTRQLSDFKASRAIFMLY